jgi:hypothetical protein
VVLGALLTLKYGLRQIQKEVKKNQILVMMGLY